MRLANKVTVGSDNQCFIHVDQKSNSFNGFMENSSSIHWLKNRIPVYWGGYSVIIATRSLIEEAYNYKCDRYVIIHGADYPLYSNGHIAEFFEKHRDVEFINAVDETIGNKREWYRYVPKNYLDNPNIVKRLKNRVNVEYWRSCLPKIPANCTINYDGKEHHIYRGWAHFAITHECAEFILDFSRSHDEFNDFFKHVYVPDESYFHTIIYNSDFVRNTVHGKPISEEERSLKSMLNLTYFEYPSSVREFKYADEFEYLRNTGCLFFRKATSKSKELLDRIDDDGD